MGLFDNSKIHYYRFIRIKGVSVGVLEMINVVNGITILGNLPLSG